MGRTIYMTESQMKACIKHQLREMELNGDQALSASNGDMNNAVRTVKNDAARNGVDFQSTDTNVVFSGDALKKNSVCEGVRIHKRDVRKAMASKLVRECRSYRKKDLRRQAR